MKLRKINIKFLTLALVMLLIVAIANAVVLQVDSDDDGLSDDDELRWSTDPLEPDTDDDKLKDGEEVRKYGTNPLDPHTDDDGLSDGEEVRKYGTNPLVWDTDGDGLSDGMEVSIGIDPLIWDSVCDGQSDCKEVTTGPVVWIIYSVVFLAGISTYRLKEKSGEWKMHYAYTVIVLLISQLTGIFTIGDLIGDSDLIGDLIRILWEKIGLNIGFIFAQAFWQKIGLILSLALFIVGIYKQRSNK